MKNDDITSSIKIAEESVKNIDDKDLKIKAFELVLKKLLYTDSVKQYNSEISNSRIRITKRRATSGSKKEIKRTTLKFTEEQLIQLKEFYDFYKPTGWETNIFVLCIFLKDKLRLELFNEADLDYCYHQLISLRTSARPPIMNLNGIKQALSWLVAPSRKKQWLETTDTGDYQVSSAGILHFKELGIPNQNETSENKIE